MLNRKIVPLNRLALIAPLYGIGDYSIPHTNWV